MSTFVGETPIPTVAQVSLRLGLVGVATVIAAWGVSFSVCLAGLDLAADERLGALALGGCLAVVHAAAMAVATAFSLREAPALRRALVRARDEGPQAPPPSRVAVRDLFEAPRRVMVGTAAPMALLLLAEGLGIYSITGLDALRRWAVVLTYLGVFQTWLLLGGQIWRSVLWGWLRHVSARDVEFDRRSLLARRIVPAHSSALVAVALPLLAVLFTHLGESAAGPSDGLWWSLGLVGFAVSVVVWVGVLQSRRLADAVGRDLERLAEEIRLATEASSWETGDVASSDHALLETAEAQRLAARIGALLRRYARLAAEEHRARQATEDTQRLKRRFMAYMSHDLRSPLNSITGFAEVLAGESDGPLNDDQRESVGTIRESGQELLRLVTAIVDSARLEAGRLVLHLAWTPPATILSSAVGATREIVGTEPTEVVAELQPGMPPVFVDGERVQQALVGLLVHVVRMVKGGRVRLAAHVQTDPGRDVGQVRVTIDASPPIPEQDSERIFEAFREIREPSGRRVGGLGLGVSLARGLMVEQGGDLWYEASGSSGARFCVVLPTEEPEPS